MTACVLYLFILLLLFPPTPTPPPQKNKSWPSHNLFLKSIDSTKIICKKSLYPVLVCTGPSPRINKILHGPLDSTEFKNGSGLPSA